MCSQGKKESLGGVGTMKLSFATKSVNLSLAHGVLSPVS